MSYFDLLFDFLSLNISFNFDLIAVRLEIRANDPSISLSRPTLKFQQQLTGETIQPLLKSKIKEIVDHAGRFQLLVPSKDNTSAKQAIWCHCLNKTSSIAHRHMETKVAMVAG